MNTTLNILISVLIMALFFIIYCMCASQDEVENERRFIDVIYINQKEIIYQDRESQKIIYKDRESQDIEMDDSNFGIRNPTIK